jgi:kojibiose phosphorylase
MNTYYKSMLSPEAWLVHEPSFNPEKLQAYESLFTLGNGYIGSRGVLEEIPYDSLPGTYIAGVFDKSISQVSEIVNLPNPVDLRISIEGEKFDVKGMYVHQHRRTLDMRNGLLFRHSVLANSKKERFNYQSVRFISSDDRHIGAIEARIKPLDADCILTVQDNINISVRNKGVLTEGRKKHFQVKEVRNEHCINYVCSKTQQSNILCACATNLKITHKAGTYPGPDQSFDIRLKKNETLTLTKIFYINASGNISQKTLREKAVKHLRKSTAAGFDKLIKRHIAKFQGMWRFSDIEISGDTQSQKALRFNIYHMLIAAHPDTSDASIGARTLSGEGYRGHVFWDTEIFLLPFYIYNFPAAARNMLMYRYNRLDAARQAARGKGFKGALFPWESADTGQDETPRWHKDFDGTIIPITTQDYEHHIVADIAYGLWQYYCVTGDRKFMIRHGAEILFETARFWASRVERNSRRDIYEIKNVMGPDEFHGNINNNSFTNGLAQWNLHVAAGFYNYLNKRCPDAGRHIRKKINLKNAEPKKWQNIAEKIYIPFDRKKDIIEQFDGYFKKKDIQITHYDKYFMPEFPPDIPFSKVSGTQLVKQLDACMLLYLVPDKFSEQALKNTVSYYEKRTVHKSSLSPSINSIMNLRSGNKLKAYQYFLNAVGADINMHQGNVAEGIHAASLGGSWQAVVFGFGGISVQKNILSINPILPDYWHRLLFHMQWHGSILHIRITHSYIEITVIQHKNKKPVSINIAGSIAEIKNKKTVRIMLKGKSPCRQEKFS